MPGPGLSLRGDYDAETCRGLAAGAEDVRQARRLLSLAAAYDGMSRAEAARIGGMDRQTLRDWVARFNADGPGGLCDLALWPALPAGCGSVAAIGRDRRDRP